MQRIFTFLAVLAVVMMLSIGGGIYWVASGQLQQSKQQETTAIAEGITTNLSTHVTLLQQLVNTLAQSPGVVVAFSSADPIKLLQTAAQLEHYIPGVLKIRLLLPNTQSLDSKETPVMGYADQDLVRESFINPQLPAIHDQGSNQHLAIAAKTVNSNTTIGVVLASIDTHFIEHSVQLANIHDGYVRLMQGELQLQERGESALKSTDLQQIGVDNTQWQLQYRGAPALDATQQSLFAGIITVVVLLAILLFYRAYRYVDSLLVSDRGMLLTATKDLINHRLHDNYPVSLAEMRFIIDALTDLNRTLKRTAQSLDTAAPYHFAEEATGFNVLNTTDAAPVNTPVLTDKPLSAPVSQGVSSGKSALDAIFDSYAIRGSVDKNLNKEVFYELGRAFGTELKHQAIHKIVLGYDGRISSPPFAEAFAKGVIATGLDVLDIGMVPIPVVTFATLQMEGQSGAMITGSHHPAKYNGLKLLIAGEPINEKQLLAVKHRVEAGNISLAASGNIERTQRYSNDYISKILADIHLARPMTVVLDCGNGVTAQLGPKLLKALGCDVIELFCDVNGHFPNHIPDPDKTENMSDLMAAVQHYQADLGIAFDGDGDRLGLVDANGKMVRADRQIQLFARQILQMNPGAAIVYDEHCPKQLGEYISRYGGQAIVWKSGRSVMHAKLKATGAKLAGEMSGRTFFNDRYPGFDDALYAAARVLEILSADTQDSAAVFAALSD
jgi:phosphomannomutase/phosphoglucomutase